MKMETGLRLRLKSVCRQCKQPFTVFGGDLIMCGFCEAPLCSPECADKHAESGGAMPCPNARPSTNQSVIRVDRTRACQWENDCRNFNRDNCPDSIPSGLKCGLFEPRKWLLQKQRNTR